MTKKINTESGFLLPILAILLATISVFLFSGLNVLRLDRTMEQAALTIKRQEIIQNTLSAYAHRNYRIPCPADPAGYGTATKADDGVERLESTDLFACDNSEVGILPWKTLGLPEIYAKDGWGRYFTYGITGVFAFNNRNIAVSGAGGDPLPAGPPYTAKDQLHARCRLQNVWVFDLDTGPGFNYRNINPFKARFCCPSQQYTFAVGLGLAVSWTYLTILGQGPGVFDIQLSQPPVPLSQSAVGADYANLDTPVAGYTADTYASSMAYVLVSHGKNGSGAYLGPASLSANRWPAGSALEDQNSDGNMTFQWMPTTYSQESYATKYFDDIVVFGTNDSLWSRVGGPDQSCARPYTDYAPMEWELGQGG